MKANRPIRFSRERTPILLVVVDTEEEFDWNQPFSREAVGVRAMDSAHLGQELFDSFDIQPTWVVDYPVASQESGFAPLKDFAHCGRAVIGAHTHPWVTPPFEESLSSQNAYPGNLPRHLEEQKLHHVSRAIQSWLGQAPLIHKAGRYGVGVNTTGILLEQGFQVDLSPAPPFDFSSDGGPDFSHGSNHPHWLNPEKSLLCLPTSGGYAGLLRSQGRWLYPMSRGPGLQRLRVPGILSRLGLLERLRLSPEGYTLEEMKRITRVLLEAGVGVVSLTFHSPSLQPGHTPYVAGENDLEQFLERLRRYCDFFLGELGGKAMTPLDVAAMIRAQGDGVHQGGLMRGEQS
ncbi:MAG: WalW protein [Magnetococcales bacterium]|nr:WalW protein [Magnetococcales bacterium]